MKTSNSNFDIPQIMGGAIERTRKQILAGDEQGFKNFAQWMSESKLTDSQREVLVAASKEFFANKK